MRKRARNPKIKHKKLFSFLALLILAAVGFVMVTNGYDLLMKKIYPLEYRDIVEREASEYHLDKALVYAVIKTESNFDPNAKSRAGAVGLMQITPPTFEWLQSKRKDEPALTEEDLLAPETNIRYGCHFLSMLLGMYPEKRTAICAYNAGIGAVNGWLDDPELSSDGKCLDRVPYPETDRYSTLVLKNYKIYQNLYHFK